jgi:2-phosphosulfolactate phosphatase
MDIDVALVPSQAQAWPETVCIVIDELRASSTLTTLLDQGASEVLLTQDLETARRLAGERGSLLAGERHGITPAGFDYNNSPSELSTGDLRGRSVVLSTSNGTAVLAELQAMPVVLVGCVLNARACAESAVAAASALGIGVGVVCAGTLGEFALDDAVAAGLLVGRLMDALAARGSGWTLSDAAIAAVRLRLAFPDIGEALAQSVAGRLVTRLGAGDDVSFCARIDASAMVPVLRPGDPLRVERLTVLEGPALVR